MHTDSLNKNIQIATNKEGKKNPVKMKSWLYKDYFNKNIAIPYKEEYKSKLRSKVNSR